MRVFMYNILCSLIYAIPQLFTDASKQLVRCTFPFVHNTKGKAEEGSRAVVNKGWRM